MEDLPRIRVAGALEGDYVILAKHPQGVLKIAPAQRGELPKVVELRQTIWASPTQWEGRLDDGRALYARSRRGVQRRYRR